MGNRWAELLKVDRGRGHLYIFTMSSESFIVQCPHCGARNRIPRERWGDGPVCARCKTAFHIAGSFPSQAITVHDWDFRGEVLDFPGPVLFEFFSPT